MKDNKEKMMFENWYLLYDGQSTDGRGHAKYLTRTTDKQIAEMHYRKIIKNPYSNGYVVILTDKTEKIVSSLNDFK
jgi:hypothetical protein